MPREYVCDANDGLVGEWYDLDDEGNRVPIAEPPAQKWFKVSVGWNRETGSVQIATVDDEADDPFSRESGLYVNLDRRGINDLIRHLRRARDSAFGRDE